MTNDEESECYEDNIKVFARILPLEEPCEECAKIDFDRKIICLRCSQDAKSRNPAIAKDPNYWCFQTHGIFYHASQEEVYRATTRDLVEKVLDGVDCVLLCYGQTGSGKSFTLGGFRNNWEHRGLVLRLLSDMLAEKKKRKKNSEIRYNLSFVEVRGKTLADLLLVGGKNRVKIHYKDAFKNVTKTDIKTEVGTLKRLFEGEARRSIVKGSAYPASHLGTSVITFHVSNTSLITAWAIVTTAKLHIVEMAGTGTVGQNNSLKAPIDVGTANLAQSELEQYFLNLRKPEKMTSNVLRSSVLLKLIGHAMSVTSMIRIIAHICVTKEDLDKTLSTLRFSAIVSRFKPVKTTYNIKPQSDQIISELRQKIINLKKELEINEIFLNQETSMNISKARSEQIYDDIMNFLKGSISDLTLYSVSQTQILLKIMKELYDKLTAKQVEVQQLGDTYEKALKNITQVTASSTISLHKNKVLHLSNNVMTRTPKGSQSHSQQVLHDNAQKQNDRVGTLIKDGVTLGPSSKEEMLTEAAIVKYSKILQNNVETESSIMKQDKDALFERFLKEERNMQLKKELDSKEGTLDAMRQTFENIINKFYQIKERIEVARVELAKQQQIRHSVETEEYNDEGNILVSVEEKKMVQDISCLEKMLNNLGSEGAEMQNKIQTLKDSRDEINLKLQTAFQEYCRKIEIIPFAKANDKISLYPENETLFENTKLKFNHLQQIIMKQIQDKEHLGKTRNVCVAAKER